MRIKGSEFKDWYDNGFPEGYFWDTSCDDIPLHNDTTGDWLIDPDQTYDLDSFGCICADEGQNGASTQPDISSETAIKRWRKARDFTLITLKVPKAQEAAVRALLKANDIKLDT